jgi:hypothetical protein
MRSQHRGAKYIIQRFFIGTAVVQAVAIFASTPILVAWKLPISCLTIVGNVVFLPFLAVFIALSMLLFFAALFSLPLGPIPFAMNKVASMWTWLLGFGGNSFFIAPRPTVITFLIIGITFACTAFATQKQKTNGRRAVALLSGALLMMALLKISSIATFPSDLQPVELKKNKGSMKILPSQNARTEIIDDGFFNASPSPQKIATYDVRTSTIENFGTLEINKVLLKRPSYRSFEGTAALLRIANIHEVEVPYFKKLPSKKSWRSFFELKRQAEHFGTKFTRSSASTAFCKRGRNHNKDRQDSARSSSRRYKRGQPHKKEVGLRDAPPIQASHQLC